MKKANLRKIFEEMGANWPSTVVARKEVAKFSGGLLQPRSMANLDSLGKGPEKISLGRLRAYPVKTFVEWLIAKSEAGEF